MKKELFWRDMQGCEPACEQKHVCGKNAMLRVGCGGMWGQLKQVKKVVGIPGETVCILDKPDGVFDTW